MKITLKETLYKMRRSVPALALGLLLLGGCTQTAQAPTSDTAKETSASPAASSDHDHHEDHVAPHGGALNGLTDEFAHLEVLLDPENGQLVVYVLDGRAAPGMRIIQPEGLKLSISEPVEMELTLEPVEDSLTGETADDTSRFQATSEQLIGASSLRATVERLEVRSSLYEQTAIAWPLGTDEHDHDHHHDDHEHTDHE